MMFFSFVNPVRASEDVTLAWDPSPDGEVVGYRIHYGTAIGEYSETIEVGNVMK